MFKHRSSKAELMDDLDLAGPALKKNLDELAFINKYLGGNDVVINALKRIIKQHPDQKTWTIGDMGSGGGDLLRVMARWMRKKKYTATLTGVDANAFMINYASDRSGDFSEIHYRQGDVFAEDAQEQYDILVFSLFCHHFSDEDLVRLFRVAASKARVAVIINDLHRHWLAWASIWFLTRVFRGSYLVQHDAPLSVLRAFKRKELTRLLQQAGASNHRLRWMWAFRYQVIYQGKAAPKSEFDS